VETGLGAQGAASVAAPPGAERKEQSAEMGGGAEGVEPAGAPPAAEKKEEEQSAEMGLGAEVVASDCTLAAGELALRPV
jgi:hypothetical protein